MAFLGNYQKSTRATDLGEVVASLPSVKLGKTAVRATSKPHPFKQAFKALASLKAKTKVVEVEKVVEKPVYVDRVVEVEKIVEVEKPTLVTNEDSVFFPSTIPDEWVAEAHDHEKVIEHTKA